jgi:glycosyltransferase involved in cell wall biosynthesis
MHIAFFGAFGSLDYYKIGGNESISRRLAEGLMGHGHQVDFVIYGAPVAEFQTAGPGIGIYRFVELGPALKKLAQDYHQVLTLYLIPRDRLGYLYFRRQQRHRLRFHQLYLSWPDSTVKRKAAFLDVRLYPLNGRLFCVSPRIYDYARRWSLNARLLLPPVPENYFLRPEDKKEPDKIRVTYIGRTEPAKGIAEVIALFKEFQDNPRIEIEIHGFHHKNSDISVQIHQWLSRQGSLRYFYTPFEAYSSTVDDNLRRILKDTDILALPYRKLSSTIDTPLLLMEGMASLCAVAVPAVGNIPDLYGPSPFLLTEQRTLPEVVQEVLESPESLTRERARIFQKNARLGFQLDQVANRFLDAIS